MRLGLSCGGRGQPGAVSVPIGTGQLGGLAERRAVSRSLAHFEWKGHSPPFSFPSKLTGATRRSQSLPVQVRGLIYQDARLGDQLPFLNTSSFILNIRRTQKSTCSQKWVSGRGFSLSLAPTLVRTILFVAPERYYVRTYGNYNCILRSRKGEQSWGHARPEPG